MANISLPVSSFRSGSRLLGRITRRLLLYVLVVGGSAAYMFPVLFMMRTSLTLESDLYVLPPIIVPWPPIWENYVEMWGNGPTWSWIKNSIIVTVFSVLAETAVSVSVAYGFARTKFAGRDKLFIGVLATMMLPGAVTLIPRWLIFYNLGMIDTLWPLLIPRIFGTAFYIFIMRQFFLTLPRELDEAARIDGATHLQILFKVVMPLSAPAIATIAVFSFMNRWNDFLEPLIYLLHTENLTLAVGLRFFSSKFGTEYHLLMAGAMLLVAPMILAFFLAQKQFVRGIALTGIKG
jgi:ABC-type glycerol-3-phosphate transport system permease component